MKPFVPHYRLFSVADSENRPGYWRFCFCSEDGTIVLDTEDLEPITRGARLELLTLVRALEALDHPSEVTVATGSRYIREGLRFGISEWKHNDWCWERFGRMIPVRNRDLWQRIDRATAIHNVSCDPRSNTADIRRNPFGDSPIVALELATPSNRAGTNAEPDTLRRKSGRKGRLLASLRQWGSPFSAAMARFVTGLWWTIPRLPMAGARLHCR